MGAAEALPAWEGVGTGREVVAALGSAAEGRETVAPGLEVAATATVAAVAAAAATAKEAAAASD